METYRFDDDEVVTQTTTETTGDAAIKHVPDLEFTYSMMEGLKPKNFPPPEDIVPNTDLLDAP